MIDSASRTRLMLGAKELGIPLNGQQAAQFEAYAALLQQWGRKMNLTARLDSPGIVTHHFLDSLSLLPFLPASGDTALVDVGAGAGFPSLPLKICLPSLSATLVESSHKKASFCREVARRLGLRNVEVIEGRAEQLGTSPPLGGAFDWAVARALGPTAPSVSLCLPFLRPRGILVLFKGPLGGAERRDLENLANRHGAALRIETVAVPYLKAGRSLVFFEMCST